MKGHENTDCKIKQPQLNIWKVVDQVEGEKKNHLFLTPLDLLKSEQLQD